MACLPFEDQTILQARTSDITKKIYICAENPCFSSAVPDMIDKIASVGALRSLPCV